MKTSENGRKEITLSEGVILTAYQDIVGVWTIGVGHTSAAGDPKVIKGMKITKEEADRILSNDLKSVENDILRLVKVPLNQNQFDALVSFVFNLGVGNFSKSTLLKKLNNIDYKGAADEFLKWDNAGGKKVKGLTDRRIRERKLFLTPVNDTVVTEKVVQKVSEVQVTPVVQEKKTLVDWLLGLIKVFLK